MDDLKNKKRKFSAISSKSDDESNLQKKYNKLEKKYNKLEKDFNELKDKNFQLELDYINTFNKKELYSSELLSFLFRFFPEDNNILFGNFYKLMKSETNFFQINEEKIKKLCPSKYKKYKNVKKEQIKLI